ncbi:hypothetical protein [Micromonospora sp. DPT]|uniref:hypothetical protein n=1 Tax=Micromonospora sp. DPT TaxID=3142975 RepID=UPI0032094212
MDGSRLRRIILVDDLRSFVDGRNAEVARSSAAAVTLLHRHRDERLDELRLSPVHSRHHVMSSRALQPPPEVAP